MLGELLELLYSARDSFSVVHASYRYSYQPKRMDDLIAARAAGYSPGSFAPVRGGVTGSPATDSVVEYFWLVWWNKPAQWRYEQHRSNERGLVSVIDGDRWWYRVPSGEIYTSAAPVNAKASSMLHEVSSNLMDPDRAVNHVTFLDPSPLLGSLMFEIIGHVTHLGRDALRVRAVPRPGRDALVDPLFWETGDEFELLVDHQRGVLLRYEARSGGETFAVAVAEHLVFDEPLAQDTFVFPVDTGVRIDIPRDR